MTTTFWMKVLLDGSGGEYTSTLKQYKSKADYFVCACVQKNEGYNVAMTPGNNFQSLSFPLYLYLFIYIYISSC